MTMTDDNVADRDWSWYFNAKLLKCSIMHWFELHGSTVNDLLLVVPPQLRAATKIIKNKDGIANRVFSFELCALKALRPFKTYAIELDPAEVFGVSLFFIRRPPGAFRNSP